MKVAVIGNHKIDKSPELIDKLTRVFVDLIENEGADTFLFGSQSQFDDLCYDIITELRYKYNHIQRIWIRVEFRYFGKNDMKRALTLYEDTFFPEKVWGTGKETYIIRIEVLTTMCDALMVYFDTNYNPKLKKSKTKIAMEYAQKKHKRIINILDCEKQDV